MSIAEYKQLATPKRRGIGEEDQMHIQFGCLMQKYIAAGRMPNVIAWSYFPAGEYRKPATASMLKKKGVACGWPDYIFFVYNKKKYWCDVYFLEFKTEKGIQQENQKNFELAFAGSPNTSYILIRSIEQVLEFLEREGILLSQK